MSGYKTTLMYGPSGNQLLLFPVDCDTHEFFATFRVTFLMMQVCFKPITWYIGIHHVRTFCSVRRHGFFVLRDVHSQRVYLQEASLQWFCLPQNCQDKIRSSCLDAFDTIKRAVSSPLEDKHIVNEHHVIRKSHDATLKKMSSRSAFQCTT